MSTTACDWVSSNERCLARTMANQEATTGSQSEESNALDLPSAYDIRDYVLQRPSQEANSEAFSSEEAFSIPCSSDTDPALLFHSSTIGGNSGGRFRYSWYSLSSSMNLLANISSKFVTASEVSVILKFPGI
ncbi:shieldin complex subunit 1 isoform X5 [Globicephala melas]|uniref:shieldin complex subunit 1 isoform X5 n=1 Tax=Globicephala melas TaxID=9731 RepID=UPI00122F9D40|nr:shieldin complex subunit 1 isoform X5 [Globicephala melas]